MTNAPTDRMPGTDARPPSQAWAGHLAALRAANDNRGDGKAASDACATPLLALARELDPDIPLVRHAADVGFRLDSCAFLTRHNSQDIWAAITQIEHLLSDERRFAPRFAFAQLRGEARLAARNEYRLAIADRDYLARLHAAMAVGIPGQEKAAHGDTAPFEVRRMDLRILHAGAFGGETADMTWATLASHRLAGVSSFWAIVHGDDYDGLRVSIETAELFRWAWAPERQADLEGGATLPERARVLDWPWLFDRLAAVVDGEPIEGATRTLALAGPWDAIAVHPELRAALGAHPAPRSLAARLDGHAVDTPL